MPKREDIIWPENRPTVPSEAISAISEFIEYSDETDIELLEKMLSNIQVLNARLRGLVEGSRHRRSRSVGTRHNIEEYILDCAQVYAAASAAFDYARKKSSELPKTIGWPEIKSALNNMGLWEHELPQVHQTIRRRSEQGLVP